MKVLLLLSLFFAGFSVQAETVENKLFTCELTGKGLQKFRLNTYFVPEDAKMLQLVLVEELDPKDRLAQSFLKLRRYFFTQEEGKLVRNGFDGAPLTRLGFVSLGDTMSFSYTAGAGSSRYNFNVITNGKESHINYSQSGYDSRHSRRGFQHSLDCQVHKAPRVDAPDIDIDDYTDTEMKAMMSELRYRNSTVVSLEEIPAEKWEQLNKLLLDYVDNYEFKTQPGVKMVRWEGGKGCGKLKLINRYDSRLKKIMHPAGKDLGYYIGHYGCENQIEIVRVLYDRHTGEPEEEIQKRPVSVGEIYLRNDFSLIGDVKELPVRNW